MSDEKDLGGQATANKDPKEAAAEAPAKKAAPETAAAPGTDAGPAKADAAPKADAQPPKAGAGAGEKAAKGTPDNGDARPAPAGTPAIPAAGATSNAKAGAPAGKRTHRKRKSKKKAAGVGQTAGKAKEAGQTEAAAKAGKAQQAGTAAKTGETDKTEPAAAKAEKPAKGPEKGNGPALTPEQAEAKDRRAAEMTRTVQVSLEQILQHMEAQPQPEPEPAQAAEEEAEEEAEAVRPLGVRIGLGVAHGAWGIFKWLLLVLLFVAVIAGAGVYWLWQGATSDMLPHIEASIDGQALDPSAYSWDVPVVNNYFDRTYAETFSEEAVPLAETVYSNHPQLNVAPNGYTTQLTLWDGAGKEMFNGTLQQYASFNFRDNGDYKARLVVGKEADKAGGVGEVSGTQTYDFSFHLSLKPLVKLTQNYTEQGGIVALTVTGTASDDVPRLETDLGHGGFIPTANGWVCYVAAAYDQEPIGYGLRVYTRDCVQDVQLAVRKKIWEARDYDDRSRLTSPYLGVEDTPEAVQQVLEIFDDQAYWTEEGFAEPFPSGSVVRLSYGTVEYVGRTQAQKDAGGGEGRAACNQVLTCKEGGKVISPAKGRVLLAENLGDDIGKTLVIEHGGGIKTVLYGMQWLAVEKGDMVLAGQQVGTANAELVAEMRIGGTPVEPTAIWDNTCDALRTH